MSELEGALDFSDRARIRREIIKKLKSEEWLCDENCASDKEYMNCVYDILSHPKCQEMNKYIQHGETTTLQHCISVSYVSYKICRAYRLDYRSAARGALLHDLFLYDWHTHRAETGERFHGFTHPKVAHDNAMKYFKLNEKEEDIILKHMWPITVIPPKYSEGFVVMYVDKYCGLVETAKRTGKYIMAKLHMA